MALRPNCASKFSVTPERCATSRGSVLLIQVGKTPNLLTIRERQAAHASCRFARSYPLRKLAVQYAGAGVAFAEIHTPNFARSAAPQDESR